MAHNAHKAHEVEATHSHRNVRSMRRAQKEKRIYDLKKKNQELEKFKMMLDFKIKGLRTMIEPREAEIAAMKEQVQEMGSELERYQKQNAGLELSISELKLRSQALLKEEVIQVRAGCRIAVSRKPLSALHMKCAAQVQPQRCWTFPQKAKLESMDAVVRRFQRDLHHTVQFLGDPKGLKACIKHLYQEYGLADEDQITRSGEVTASG